MSRTLLFPGMALLAALCVGVSLAEGPQRRPAVGRRQPITKPSEVVKLVAADARDGDEFGRSVAIHGATIVVGAPGEVTHVKPPSAGSAYVFSGKNWTWHEAQKLVAPDHQEGASFGRAVAVWEDTIAVGAEHENLPGVGNAGAVHVFVQHGSEWNTQQRLVADDPRVQGHFGHALSLHEGTLVVGTWGCNKVYIYQRSGDTWTQVQRLHEPSPEGGNFGVSVALSDTTLVVGSESSGLSGYPGAGAAFVFERNHGTWELAQELTALDAHANDRFGGSVAISDDTIAAGALLDDHGSSTNSGSTYIFTRTDAGWVETQKLISSAPAGEQRFGSSVCVCRNHMMIGAPQDKPLGIDNAGCGYFYTRSVGAWRGVDTLWASDARAGNLFGEVAVHGRTAVVGARLADHSDLIDPGAAYVFLLPVRVN